MEKYDVKTKKGKSKKKIFAVLLSIFIILILAIGIILISRIRTILSIQYVQGDLYKVDYYADYKLDKMLEQGVSSTEELENFLSQELFFGYPVSIDEDLFGCTAFAAQSPDGELLVGRNFDYARSGALLVYTQPENGYASYSMVSLSHLGVSETDNTMPDTLMGKLAILASPYACVEGLNEKGLCVAVLELQTEPTAQDNGKKDIITTVAARMLLDKCATTEEAISLLNQFDMFSSVGVPYHFFITDADNNSVVVAYPEQEMDVVEASYATNFQLSSGNDYGVGIGHDRYNTVGETLEKSTGILTESEAMELLKNVKVEWDGEWDTEWSIVYNLSAFSLKICNDMNYNEIFQFGAQ